MLTLQEYIEKNLKECIRYNPENRATKNTDNLIGLPYPYTVPCASGVFQELYYWDTYFINKGLIECDMIEQARNNVNNMFYLIKKYGFVPNANRTGFLRVSQPPFLSLMVLDIYNASPDKAWLKEAYEALCTEHKFWQEKRTTEIGLNRYYCMNIDPNGYENSLNYFSGRLGFRPDGNPEILTKGFMASCECGWDLNPRTAWKTPDYAMVDLNSLMYAMEKNLSFFADELGLSGEAVEWDKAAKKRAELIRKYLLADDGVFYDYNYTDDSLMKLASVACFYPMYCGLATKEEAESIVKLLPRLETEFGIATCEKNDIKGVYQWDYPNGWAPMHIITAFSLLKYGYKDDALRIAKKFNSLVEKCYSQTGNMWEKYNVEAGNAEAKAEYETPAMLGWTFGAYTVFSKLLRDA
ncbi:MAG: alpha,alpha-trehalase [Clostridia bacterium]|nr:alpha,alpha-trehalase [Clostridia bacterium]